MSKVHFHSDALFLYVNILDWPEAMLASQTHLTEFEILPLGEQSILLCKVISHFKKWNDNLSSLRDGILGDMYPQVWKTEVRSSLRSGFHKKNLKAQGAWGEGEGWMGGEQEEM